MKMDNKAMETPAGGKDLIKGVDNLTASENSSPQRVILLLGSNSEDASTILADALEELQFLFPEGLKTSEPFTGEDITKCGPPYTNIICVGQTTLPYNRLNVFIKATEWRLGRETAQMTDSYPAADEQKSEIVANSQANQTSNKIIKIDIDIYYYGDSLLKPALTQIPGFSQALQSIK